MNPTEELERRGIERLRTETYPIHSRRTHPGEFCSVHRARIGFEGYFGIGVDSAKTVSRVDNLSD